MIQNLLIWELLREEGVWLRVFFELLEMLECLVESCVADAKWGENVATVVGRGLFDVVVLEINKFLILDCPLGVLTMEKYVVGFDFVMFFTVLDVDIGTWFRY